MAIVAWLHGLGVAKKAIGSATSGATFCETGVVAEDAFLKISESAQINTILSWSNVLNIASSLPSTKPST